MTLNRYRHVLSIIGATTLLPLVAISTVLLSAGFVSGCVDSAKVSQPNYYSKFRYDREVLMRTRWSGRLYVDLVSDMGREGVSMTMPSSGGRSYSAVIFGINDPISGCVDSFVVVNGDEPIIDNYYCR